MQRFRLFLLALLISASAEAYELSVTFVHTASVANIDFNVTYLDHPKLNGNPDAMFIVTQNWNPPGSLGVYNDHNFGVWYDGSVWSVYNEDIANMPEGSFFNVIIPGDDVEVFQHVAGAANISGHVTVIDNPLLNNNPDAVFHVTPNWNFSTYNDHPTGIWYTGTNWTIFNQDFASMPEDAAFFIMVISDETDDFVFTTEAGNIDENYAVIDNSLTNGNREEVILYTQNWNPGGTGGTYNNHNTGLWYYNSVSQWSVFNQDFADMTEGASFNMFVAPSNVHTFIHTATTENSIDQVTYIDHPMINGDDEAIIFATQNWNPGGVGGVYNAHTFGVWYDTFEEKWSVFNQDIEDIPEGASFTISVLNKEQAAFVHHATVANIVSNWTNIDHPWLNGNPEALFFVSQNWNPTEGVNVYNDHSIGVWYTGSNWAIFNQDEEEMPEDASFNILIPNDSLNSFVHYAAEENVSGNSTIIDNPEINNDPDAILLVTQNWNPGNIGGTYNDHPIGVWYTGTRWAVFNQDLETIPEGAAFNVGIVRGSGFEAPVAIEEFAENHSSSIELLNVYPNPFDEITQIDLILNKDSEIELMIFDINGKVVEVIENKFLPAGEYHYTFYASTLSPGVYLCTLKRGKEQYSRQIQIVR